MGENSKKETRIFPALPLLSPNLSTYVRGEQIERKEKIFSRKFWTTFKWKFWKSSLKKLFFPILLVSLRKGETTFSCLQAQDLKSIIKNFYS